MGRSPMIKEEDCSIPLPSPVSDEVMDEGDAWMNPTPDMNRTALLSTILVVAGLARMFRLLKLAEIPLETLRIYDAHFEKVLKSFPRHHQHQNTDHADLTELYHAIYLHNARLVLHRHNLAPDCDPQARSRAIENCTAVARSTAALVRKCMQDLPSTKEPVAFQRQKTWEERVKFASSDFVCTHVWRCTLWLLHQRYFSEARDCAHFSQALGDSRPVNIACGRYLDFFLAQLIQKSKQKIVLDSDEELLAYASGDLQANYECSWIWEHGAVRSKSRQDTGEHLDPVKVGEVSTAEAQSAEWAGWGKVVELVDELAREQHSVHSVREDVTLSKVRQGPIHLPPLVASPSPSAASTPRDRLSIKDLL